MRGKVQKFVLIPICTIYNEQDDVVREERMRPITVFVTTKLDLRATAEKLQERVNSEYMPKLTGMLRIIGADNDDDDAKVTEDKTAR